MLFDELVDASNERCPMPLLRLKQRINKVSSGAVIKLIATDAGSVKDIPTFVDMTDHELLHHETVKQETVSQDIVNGDVDGDRLVEHSYVYYIKKC